jgi:NAD(P)-dependent dehydrogenase (short-subunit alcohol dehydrogenase family)
MDTLSRMGLKDKVAVVNGGGLGIGRSSCLLLAEAGANVAVVDVISQRAKGVAQEVRAIKRKALPVVADILHPEGVEKMVQAVLAEFGTIDILVNIIGHIVRKPVLEITEEDWDLDLQGNLKYVWLNAKAVAKVMIDQKKKGSIINIASMSGTTASPVSISYGAAKAGLIQMTKTLAIVLGAYNIRVNCVTPGGTRTPGTIEREKHIPIEQILARNKTLNALGRMADPDEIAGGVLYLASDLSSYVTGQSLIADGGSMVEGGRSLKQLWM